MIRLKHVDSYCTWREANSKFDLLSLDEIREFLHNIEYEFNLKENEGVFKYKDGHEPLKLPAPFVSGKVMNISYRSLGVYWLKDRCNKKESYCLVFTDTGYAIAQMPNDLYMGVLIKK